MISTDLAALLAVAADASEPRFAAAARTVLDHAEQFPLDGTHPDAQGEFQVYAASLVADLLALAESMPGTSAKDVLNHAAYYLGDQGVVSLHGVVLHEA